MGNGSMTMIKTYGRGLREMLFRILGPLEIEKPDGEIIAPWAPKIRTLLAHLCCHDSTTVSTEGLTKALWSNTPPRSSTTALHVYVSQLRARFRALGMDASTLVTQPTGYRLRLPPSALDLNLFESRLADARALQNDGRLDEASAALASAVGLWRGPALDGFRGLPAFEGIGRLLDEKRNLAQEQRLRLELDLGHHQSLIGELVALAETHPTWEAVHGYLMISLYRSGRTADALNVFDRLRGTLVDELGIEPGPALQRIQRSVLAGETWPTPPSTAARSRGESREEVQGAREIRGAQETGDLRGARRDSEEARREARPEPHADSRPVHPIHA